MATATLALMNSIVGRPGGVDLASGGREVVVPFAENPGCILEPRSQRGEQGEVLSLGSTFLQGGFKICTGKESTPSLP
jgi:hypothetical protein